MDMIEDRNLLVHTYTFEESGKIFERIKEKYFELFKELCEKMKEEFLNE